MSRAVSSELCRFLIIVFTFSAFLTIFGLCGKLSTLYRSVYRIVSYRIVWRFAYYCSAFCIGLRVFWLANKVNHGNCEMTLWSLLWILYLTFLAIKQINIRHFAVLLTLCGVSSFLIPVRDGMISKSEMKTYFIRANCHALRKCFKHDFHETTYFKPTFCIHCTGLVCIDSFHLQIVGLYVLLYIWHTGGKYQIVHKFCTLDFENNVRLYQHLTSIVDAKFQVDILYYSIRILSCFIIHLGVGYS